MNLSPPEPSADLTVEAVPRSIGIIRTAIAEVAELAGAAAETIAAIRLAVSEAVTNAVRHAYDEGRRAGEVRATARVERHDGSELIVVSVSDDGPGMRPRPDSPGLGLGLPLIARSARSLDIINDDPGTTICMRFALP